MRVKEVRVRRAQLALSSLKVGLTWIAESEVYLDEREVRAELNGSLLDFRFGLINNSE